MTLRCLTVLAISAMLAGCAASPEEDVAAGEGASTVDVSEATVVAQLSKALVGKSLVTTADVSFDESGGSWTSAIGFTLPSGAGITATNGKAADNLFCTLLTTDNGAGYTSRSIPKGTAHTITGVTIDTRIKNSYDLSFTDPDTKTTSNFTGLCTTNIPFASNTAIR